MKKIFFLAAIVVAAASVVSIAAFNKTKVMMYASPVNGEKAPNLIYKNPEDKVMALSELKGKMVLMSTKVSSKSICSLLLQLLF